MGKRIGIFIPSLTGGGAQRVVVILANGLAARGLTVDLVLANAHGPYLNDVDESVRIVDLQRRRVLASIIPLAAYLREFTPSVLISAMDYANVAAICAKVISRRSTTVVITEHNDVTTTRSHARGIARRLMPWLMRVAYRHADAVIAVSKGVADDLAAVIGLARERIQVIYNPVEIDAVAELCRASSKHSWLADGARPFILGAGRLSRQKDFGTLITAFKRVRQQRNVRLVILGEGEDRAILEDLVKQLELTEDVLLPGYVKNPFVWMRRASLFVLSSAWEGFGNVLVEAMACGTPVVSTDCPSGPAEILEDGVWGSLVPVGDVAELTNAIVSGLNAKRQNVDALLERAKHFHPDIVVGRYLQALRLES